MKGLPRCTGGGVQARGYTNEECRRHSPPARILQSRGFQVSTSPLTHSAWCHGFQISSFSNCATHQSHEKLLNSRSLHAFDFSEHVVGPNINVMHTHLYLYTDTLFDLKKKKKKKLSKWLRRLWICQPLPPCSGL